MKKLLSILLVLVMVCGIVPAMAEEAPVRGGTLVVAKSQDMSTKGFDITHTTFSQYDCYVLSQVFETLIKTDAEGAFVPGLAESWEYTADGLGLVLKLRQDVSYSDGQKFNAEAAAKVMNYYLTEECKHVNKGSDLALITGIDVVDEYTIQVNTSAPDAGLLTILTGNSFMLMSPANIDNQDVATNPIGTGPFVLAEYVEGDHITLKANPGYYKLGADGKPLPYLDEIVYKIMTDDSVKTTNLKSGDVDGVDIHGSTNSVLTAMAMSDMTTYEYDYAINFWAGWNFTKEQFQNVKLRQAFAYAIDRQEIVDVVFEGLASTTAFFSKPSQWWYSDYATIDEYNPEKAKALLAEAGYPDGIEMEISGISREPDNSILALMQAQMAEAGINLKINAMERTAWVSLVKTELGHEMCIGQNGNAGVDVSRQLKDPMVSYVSPEYAPAAEMQAIYNSLKSLTNEAERKAAVDQLQAFYHDNTMQLIICQSHSYCTFASYVKDIQFNSIAALDFSETWMAK